MVQYRQAIYKWAEFVNIEQNIDQRVVEAKEVFRLKRISWAINKMYDHSIKSKELKRRNNQIRQYYFDKQAIKIFEMFKMFLSIRRQERCRLEIALHFRAYNLTSKAYRAWNKYMADNYELFVKKKAVIKRLRQLKCPDALKQWSKFTELSKCYNKKKQKAI